MTLEKCFACGRAIPHFPPIRVDTRDGQTVFVGSECAQRVREAGDAGWQPPLGGPKLYPLPPLVGRESVDSRNVGCCAARSYDFNGFAL